MTSTYLTHGAALIYAVLLVSSGSADPLKSNSDASLNILFGKSTNDPIPYQVSVQTKYKGRWAHSCGGAIISPNYIVTAAHCLLPYRGKRVRIHILAGTNSLARGGSRHDVTGFKTHPDYKIFEGSDIAVAKVSPEFKLNGRTIEKIDFESRTAVPGNTLVILTGWGFTGVKYPTTLQIARFRTWSNKKCRCEAYESLSSTDICAIGDPSSQSSWGDSGGPLVNKEKTMLVGIVSYSTNDHTMPSVFTRVSFFVDWIKKEISK